MGKEIDNPDSVYYWAYKVPSPSARTVGSLHTGSKHDQSKLLVVTQNNIPVFCPAITDGSVGDMMFFHSYKRDGFICDIAQGG